MLLSQQLVKRFIDEAVQHGDYEYEDAYYIQNQLLTYLNAEGVTTTEEESNYGQLDANEITQLWITQAIDNELLEDSLYRKEITEANILDLITPKPSQINKIFWEKYQNDHSAATDYFYDISKRNHYVKEDAIAKNINYTVPTEYGELEITINLSKPEKDAKQIAREKAQKTTNYPKCALCMENEGFEGSVTQAARRNHRIIRLQLGQHRWGFQYSPYAYFKEHSIVLSERHEPMNINRETFVNLLDFIDQFPHYFIGSNADIPIVGGSILSHNHYQAGRYTFPMDLAAQQEAFQLTPYPAVTSYTLQWPMSVIRLKSKDKAELIEAATYVMEQWNSYSDIQADIKAVSEDGQRHHTVTPIARYRAQQYEVDIVLRDNQTSEQYPEGIYHPHRDVQHIKQENIGLIEVMGTAILPGRLKKELQDVKRYLLGDYAIDIGSHKTWADQMLKQYNFTNSNVDSIVEQEVGKKFTRVLEDAGVFKQTVEGKQAFHRFTSKL